MIRTPDGKTILTDAELFEVRERAYRDARRYADNEIAELRRRLEIAEGFIPFERKDYYRMLIGEREREAA